MAPSAWPILFFSDACSGGAFLKGPGGVMGGWGAKRVGKSESAPLKKYRKWGSGSFFLFRELRLLWGGARFGAVVAVSELQSAPPLGQVGIGDKHKLMGLNWAYGVGQQWGIANQKIKKGAAGANTLGRL
jgi:hypothetical protein